MAEPGTPYYRRDLALVHHLGFGFHADDCAPGILELLRSVRERDGLVVELGCGSGLLTRHLVDAGHRVIATDASAAMLDLAGDYAVGAEDIRKLVLPDDPIPEADAIVSVGHVLSYLPDAAAIDRALLAIAEALRPGGVMALDLCDHSYAEAGPDFPIGARVADEWAIITERSTPTPDRFVRQMDT
jgi:SAM-dependent methyltransferase